MRWATSLTAMVLVAVSGCQRLRFWEKPGTVPITRASEQAEITTTTPAEPLPAEPAPAGPDTPYRPEESPPPIPLDGLEHQPAPTDATQPSSRGSEVVTGAMIQINGKFLTVDDILHIAALDLGKIPPGVSEGSFRSRAEKIITEEIRRRVSQSLALPEAERILNDDQRRLIGVEVDETVAAMIAQFDGSRRKLQADLTRQGTTLEAVTENHRRELTVRWFLRLKFASSVSVNRAMLWDYYNRHKQEFSTPKKVQMQTITVPISAFLATGRTRPTAVELDSARTAARSRIGQAALAVRKGEEFGEVARHFSSDPKTAEGGLWPLMPIGSFRQEMVEKVAFAQAAGQVSDVIETEEGFALVKTVVAQEAVSTSFEDAQADIEKILRDQQAAKLYNDYYAELIKNATIVQSDNFLLAAVQRALEHYQGK